MSMSITIHTFKLTLGIWVELHSRYYSQEILFIPVLIVENTIHRNTITEHIGIVHYSYEHRILLIF